MRIGKSRLHSLGSDGLVAVSEGVAACEIAVPPGPHINSAIDELATARVDENLMAVSSQCGGIQFYRRQDITFGCELGHGRFRIRPGGRTLGDLAEIRTAP
jgi:hypothetical protein